VQAKRGEFERAVYSSAPALGQAMRVKYGQVCYARDESKTKGE